MTPASRVDAYFARAAELEARAQKLEARAPSSAALLRNEAAWWRAYARELAETANK